MQMMCPASALSWSPGAEELAFQARSSWAAAFPDTTAWPVLLPATMMVSPLVLAWEFLTMSSILLGDIPWTLRFKLHCGY